MANDQVPPEQLAAPNGGQQLLTVNMVMPALGDSAKEGASFARLFFGLSALALERFGAVRENCCQDALQQTVPSALARVRVDPFDGQLLRFRHAESGYELHSIHPDQEQDSGGKGEPALTVVGSAQVSPLEWTQSQAASNP
jgi:hypothetical protein